MAGDPPSGRFRRGGDDPPSPRRTDYPRETTRPGPHVDDTLDDFRDEPTPIREFHRLEQRVANVEGVALETRIRLEQADSLPSTEWAQRVDKQIAAVAVDAKAGADLAAVKLWSTAVGDSDLEAVAAAYATGRIPDVAGSTVVFDWHAARHVEGIASQVCVRGTAQRMTWSAAPPMGIR